MSIDRFPVESTQTMLFARAVLDPNPLYSDPDVARARGFASTLAPPTFVQSGAHFDDEYPLRPRPGEPWFGSGGADTGVSQAAPTSGVGRVLHAEQHFEYHRPLVAGTTLRATATPARSWEKQGRSGRLVFSEWMTEFRDLDGDLIVTTRSVSVRTEPSGEAGT